MHTWQLRKSAFKRFRSGHPWVFSNELTQSPKGLPPGELVKLVGEDGEMLATGYGNPRSLISFRVLSRESERTIDSDFFFEKFQKAMSLRRSLNLHLASHRMVFAENDYLPGLIIDRYILAEKGPGQVLVCQASTAGMDHLSKLWLDGLQKLIDFESKNGYSNIRWEDTTIVLSPTSSSRVLEGLTKEKRSVFKSGLDIDLSAVQVLIASAAGGSPVPFKIDILNGQKTGFFLDQRQNVHALIEFLKADSIFISNNQSIRILDLCTYVGQWSTQLASYFSSIGKKVELHLFDTSDQALKIAAENVAKQGGMPAAIKGDVLKDLHHLPDRSFDIVICDPPAFIKKKKDIATGQAAYLKLNKEAIKKVRAGGYYVSCSCSGLLGESDFKSILGRISHGEQYSAQWLYQGFHSPDHPQRLEFPEGTYLKCLISKVNKLD